ncbi:MAG: ferrous iron transport protein A [Nitratiruptor sp.]|nr:ferrous iron transport protein A [Nitratiruptor sp.]NPA84158.1 ferrous iron transport protein A [Campylobacterota bacterium]
MKLSEAKVGDLVRIRAFDGEDRLLEERLRALGIGRGAVVEVVQKSLLGPITVEIDGSKVALCRGQAKRIDVEKL